VTAATDRAKDYVDEADDLASDFSSN
jgi:hypothetical protein